MILGETAMGKCRKLEDSEIEAMKAHTTDLRDKAILVFLERPGIERTRSHHSKSKMSLISSPKPYDPRSK
jgi:hypothetical protein